MKKILLILSFILLSVVSFAQRQRTTAMFDSDTTTRPKAGFYGIGVRANNIYFVPPTGNNIRLANYSLFTGLNSNYLPKWNGSKLVNSGVFDNGAGISIGTNTPTGVIELHSGNPYSLNMYRTYDVVSGGAAANILSMGALAGTTKTDAAQIWGILNDANLGDLAFFTRNTTMQRAMTLTSSGNVGIGTASPSVKTEISSTDNNISLRINTENSGISSSNYSEIQLADNGAVRSFLRNVRDGTGKIILSYNDHLSFLNSYDVEKIRFTSDGNVGIGTTTPNSKLQVKDGDIEVETIGSGLILKSPDGTRWRVTVSNLGLLVITSI